MLLEISGEITPERMKGWSQNKKNTQLWMLLVIKARSVAVRAILHKNMECQAHKSSQIGSGQTRHGKSECRHSRNQQTKIDCCCCCIASVVSDSVRPQRRQPTRLPRPWDSPGKNTGVGCHFLPQCMNVKSESEVAQSCPTPSDPVDSSPPGSSIAFSVLSAYLRLLIFPQAILIPACASSSPACLMMHTA